MEGQRDWYRRNKQRHAENRRRWTEAHRDQKLEYDRAYAEAHRAEARERAAAWARNNPERHRYNGRKGNWRFRARRTGGSDPIDDFDFDEIFARDEGVCGICFVSVPKEVATLDHVIPFARGGMHERANVQVAHRSCNASKANSLPFDKVVSRV